jgi:hypothetical protein
MVIESLKALIRCQQKKVHVDGVVGNFRRRFSPYQVKGLCNRMYSGFGDDCFVTVPTEN